jgi:adenosylcobinamide kinase/adenosylcobinamide-phosphate guanylyltransferase
VEHPRITLITGGARSGKSSYALTLAGAYPPGRRYFVATAEARDAEFADRIERHRRDRGDGFVTVEEPVALARALDEIDDRAAIVVIDCLTLWIANLMERALDDDPILQRVDGLIAAARRARFHTVMVSGEVGSAIVPENPLARRFRDLLGWANQRIAQNAERAILMVAGCPLILK